MGRATTKGPGAVVSAVEVCGDEAVWVVRTLPDGTAEERAGGKHGGGRGVGVLRAGVSRR